MPRERVVRLRRWLGNRGGRQVDATLDMDLFIVMQGEVTSDFSTLDRSPLLLLPEEER
jgi:hypothetical protein